MTTVKKLAIWLDHSSAHLIEFTTEPFETRTIVFKFSHEDKVNSLVSNGEKHMHKKEQHKQSEYYKELGEAIKNYEDVLLFGPTESKVELLNILRADHQFSKINIEIKQTDKMTENQQHAFVRDYFSNLVVKS